MQDVKLWKDFKFFGAFDECLKDEESNEKLAKTLNAVYTVFEIVRDSEAGTIRKEWKRLREEYFSKEKDSSLGVDDFFWKEQKEKFRWSSRYQAGAFLEKMRSLGYDLDYDKEFQGSAESMTRKIFSLESPEEMSRSSEIIEKALTQLAKAKGADAEAMIFRETFDELSKNCESKAVVALLEKMLEEIENSEGTNEALAKIKKSHEEFKEATTMKEMLKIIGQLEQVFEIVKTMHDLIKAAAKEAEQQSLLDDTELEYRLACANHNRWWAERVLAGWKYADKTQKENLEHEDMKEFDKLSEVSKERDTQNVRQTAWLLSGVMGLRLKERAVEKGKE
ncbi:MAG: hypothetical protein GX635_11465 [Synergistaceae bacterium]|nr:hypothetical protein [Synergistaceae bacterium]